MKRMLECLRLALVAAACRQRDSTAPAGPPGTVPGPATSAAVPVADPLGGQWQQETPARTQPGHCRDAVMCPAPPAPSVTLDPREEEWDHAPDEKPN
jgi:hypothetical protein